MARNREKKANLKYQLKDNLNSKLRIGESKYEAKINNTAHEGIYSWSTYNSYLRHSEAFLQYAKDNHGVGTIEEARMYVDEYLQSRIDAGLSSYTIKLDAAALAKVYDCSSTDFIETPKRIRSDIKRSRDISNIEFSEKNNQDLVDFAKATGLRKAEIKALRGNDLITLPNGQIAIKVHRGAKGGRQRVAPVIKDHALVSKLMSEAKDGLVFTNVPNRTPIHYYRSMYATEYYDSIARDLSNLDTKDMYICRCDLAGVRYDREAMLQVSRALGHNRIDVIASHYLRASALVL